MYVGDTHSSVPEHEWIFHCEQDALPHTVAICVGAWLSLLPISTLILPNPIGPSDDPYSRCQHVASVDWSRVNTVPHARLPKTNTLWLSAWRLLHGKTSSIRTICKDRRKRQIWWEDGLYTFTAMKIIEFSGTMSVLRHIYWLIIKER